MGRSCLATLDREHRSGQVEALVGSAPRRLTVTERGSSILASARGSGAEDVALPGTARTPRVLVGVGNPDRHIILVSGISLDVRLAEAHDGCRIRIVGIGASSPCRHLVGS